MAEQARGRPKRRQATPHGRRRQAVPLRGGGRRGLGVTRLRQWGERGIARAAPLFPPDRAHAAQTSHDAPPVQAGHHTFQSRNMVENCLKRKPRN
nr:MAG TPA: hypothetical protein [Caudoviricetes sp.]